MLKSLAKAMARLHALAQQVKQHGACSLPGVSIDYGRLRPMIERAVSRGFVSRKHASFVINGLWYGFDLGIDVTSLKGKRWFRNYKSADEHREKVTDAIRDRVRAHKTLALCACSFRDARLLPWQSCRVFPLGAVPKPLEPDKVRPVSDHTKSGLKAATDDAELKHSLDTYAEIAAFFKRGYVMRMMDVKGAFPLLPLAPILWVFFLHWWYTVDERGDPDEMWLYAHLTGDFGAAGMPGTWKIFFSDVMIGVARSEGVLTLPMPVYVDDCSLIGPVAVQVDTEGAQLTDWLESLGVTMKRLKERLAACLQLALGFWWDSISRTRTLEEHKLHAYVQQLREFEGRRSITLREMQQVGGRMQRALLTLPRGAHCFMAALFALMRGLSLPWQQRRTSRALRSDFKAVADLLMVNLGRGFFAFDHMERAPDVYTDASKDARYAGGGYFSTCGRFRWWTYGSAARKQPIDFLEGDAVLLAVMDMGELWRGKIVPLHIDNRSFQRSAVKGWSKAERLYLQLRALFMLSVKLECVFEFHWISTHDNIYADALSRRDGERAFFALVRCNKPLMKGGKLQKHASSGMLRKFGKEYSSDYTGDGPVTAADWGGVEVRPSSVAGLGLFARVRLHAEERVVRINIPFWMSPEAATARAASMGLPHDSFVIREVDGHERACVDLWWSAWMVPMWYRMNHRHKSRANVRMQVVRAYGVDHLVWYATRNIQADEEIRFDYGDVDDAWNADDLRLPHKRPRPEPGAMSDAKRRKGAESHGRRFSSDEDGDGPQRGQASTSLSVQYTRASIFVGLPQQGLAARVDEIMDSRLAPSSHESIHAALGHWRVVCSRHRWPEVIASDDPSRGGKLAALMVYMVDETDLAGTSIMTYVWAIRAYMKFCRQLDPVMGVVEWDDWSQAVQVVAWVQGEPRRMVPLELVRSALERVEPSSFLEVQAAVMLLLLLFTFARSETPCPKTLGGFDPDQHLRVCDVAPVASPFRVRVRLKRIKQDRRQERPEARGDGDWVVVGDTADDPTFSIRLWMQRLLVLHGGARAAEAPFFVGADKEAPLTYQSAMRHVRALYAKASSQEEAMKYGLHSLRVTGYTLAKRSAGEALAVAQGGWHGDSHQRYERFSMEQVVALPAAIITTAASEEEATAAAVARAAPAPPTPPNQGHPQVPARDLPTAQRRAVGAMASPPSRVASAARRPAATPLTSANCVGRRVLCPQSMWPSWPCKEHGGRGWEATVDKVDSQGVKVLVRFLTPNARTRKWKPMWVQLSALQII